MIEIERKYLVNDDAFIAQASHSVYMAQGYLCSKRVTARVRVADDKAFLTIKGKSADGGLSRFEFERQIPLICGKQLLARCQGVVAKRRYYVPYGSHTWEVDVFEGMNQGLVVAEVEMAAADEQVVLPAWVWTEVTADYHYRNSYLAKRPYKSWFK